MTIITVKWECLTLITWMMTRRKLQALSSPCFWGESLGTRLRGMLRDGIVTLIVFLLSRGWTAHRYIQDHHQGWCILWGGGEGEELFLLCSYYCICLIRRRGYYLFHYASLYSFCSRAATNHERRLLNSVLSVKSFGNVIRALRKACFIRLTKNYDVVTWFWSQPSSFLISRHFATKRYLHGTSNLFPCFLLPMTSHVDRPLCLKQCQTSLDSSVGTRPSCTHVLLDY